MERATCWSITINNPVSTDYTLELPAKWKLCGQLEQGKEGTTHYQGMLTTPQTRFSSVKKLFPRAHIEVARNKSALEKYVHKEETRLQKLEDNVSVIPTLFDYQHTIATKWDDKQFDELRTKWKDDPKKTIGDIALDYVDSLVAIDIETGIIGVEYIAINPMWRSAWKKFFKSMVVRERAKIKSNEVIYDGETTCENQWDESSEGEQDPEKDIQSP